MFFNLRANIFIYYFVSVVAFLALFYYEVSIVGVDDFYILGFFLLLFITISAIFISKLALDPLVEYTRNLQALSKETLHELNLPISTILTNINMLQKTAQDAKTLRRIERIHTACDMLQERYNELEYMINMQSKNEVQESFFVDKLVLERLAFLENVYPNVKMNVSVEALQIYGDKKGLAKVIDNIVDNGVKYSPNSKTIEIQLKNKILSIQDFGIGIDEVALVHIFDRYYQADQTMQGFGIGLNMVKHYCDTHSIELSFVSQPNKGTTVKLNFKNK